jgi:hypothetical protein
VVKGKDMKNVSSQKRAALPSGTSSIPSAIDPDYSNNSGEVAHHPTHPTEVSHFFLLPHLLIPSALPPIHNPQTFPFLLIKKEGTSLLSSICIPSPLF